MHPRYRETLAPDRRRCSSSYRLVDVARKVVGVGSVGTVLDRCCCSAGTTSDPLFLQIKEAQPSVLEPYVGASRYDNHGERVVAGSG